MLTLNQKITKIREDLFSLFSFQNNESGGIIEIAVEVLTRLDTMVSQLDNETVYQPRLTIESDISLNVLQANQIDVSGVLTLGPVVVNDRLTELDNAVIHLEQTKQPTLGPSTNLDLNDVRTASLIIGETDILNALNQIDISLEILDQTLSTKQPIISESTNLIANQLTLVSDLYVGGKLTVDGSFNVGNLIYNTLQNEVVISTQLDISNQGMGPALKVSQFGDGDEDDVALFHAGSEGDALRIDSVGNVMVYKQLNVGGDVLLKGVNIELKLDEIDQSFQQLENRIQVTDASLTLLNQQTDLSFDAVAGQLSQVDVSLVVLSSTKQDKLTHADITLNELIITNDLRVNGNFILDGSINVFENSNELQGDLGPPGPTGDFGQPGPPYMEDRPLALHEFDGLPENTTYTFGSLDPAAQWSGGVLTNSGKIYCVPNGAHDVLVITPINDSISYVPNTQAGARTGGVIAPNQKLYAMPSSDSGDGVLVVDTSSNEITTLPVTGPGGWSGAVLAPNGSIYGIPSSHNSVLVIQPNQTVSYILAQDTSGVDNVLEWTSGVLAPNGNIYCSPNQSTQILVIHTKTNTISFIGNLDTIHQKWAGGALAHNKKIYFTPYHSSNMLIVDTTTDAIDTQTITDLSGNGSWIGSVFAPSGLIYCIPSNHNHVLVIDPTDNTFLYIETASGAGNEGEWFGGVLANNGKIYGIPHHSSQVLAINTGLPIHPLWMLQAYFNHF